MDKIIEKGFKKEDNKDNQHRVTCTSLPNTHKHTILKTILKKTKIINPKQIIIIIIKKKKNDSFIPFTLMDLWLHVSNSYVLHFLSHLPASANKTKLYSHFSCKSSIQQLNQWFRMISKYAVVQRSFITWIVLFFSLNIDFYLLSLS